MENIVFTTDAGLTLGELLRGVGREELFVVADKYTVRFCDELFGGVDWEMSRVAVLGCGEEGKSIAGVMRVWTMLSECGARRSSVLVCVGGGVVTDVGGFVASTFKRGMRCIYVPTTLLAQVDASLGGKTGFNFNGLKNEVGTFSAPEQVVVDPSFFRTLPVRERVSGFAEMLKHGLLSDRGHLDRLLACDPGAIEGAGFLALIRESIEVKDRIVSLDPWEKGIRKALNLGHTVGHAIESLAIRQEERVLHGEAVAWGLVTELYLSMRLKGFPEETYERVRGFVRRFYPACFLEEDREALYEFMLHDKKNERRGINFTLMEDVGRVSIDNYCSRERIVEALLEVWGVR